ncbi:MAG: DUF58 domain-containing protein [Thermoplasmatota archaeon]
MWSRFSFYYIGFAIIALILGSLLRSWVFLIIAIANISFLAVALLGLPPKKFDVKVSRKEDLINLYEGDEVKIEISLKNHGDDIQFLEIYDPIPENTEVVEGNNHLFTDLKKGEKKAIEYTLSCPIRGEMIVGPLKIRYRDSLNMFFKNLKSKIHTDIRVLPEIEKMKNVKIRPSYTRNWLGNIPSNSIGIGTEFFSLREYLPGDELRKINWKATARSSNPITNEYEGERSGDIVLVVEGFKGTSVGTLRKNTIKASIKAAASLASSMLEDRNRVGLIVLGDYLNWVYPGYGRDQFYKIIDNLSKIEKGGFWKATDAKWFIKRFFPKRSLIVFITPLLEEKSIETVMDMCMKEFDVMVISPNPIEIEKEITEDYNPTAERILKFERNNIINRLWRYATVVDWNPNEPLEAALNDIARYKKRRRHL